MLLLKIYENQIMLARVTSRNLSGGVFWDTV